jgi:hypothetical protein
VTPQAGARQALLRIDAAGVRRGYVEKLLGLSPGYLSRIASGKKVSTQLACCLHLIGQDPIGRVGELEQICNVTVLQEDHQCAS